MNGQRKAPENLIQMVKNAGIVGEGGAGFPAHVKYDSRVDTVIANGCECEPLLYSDQHVMSTYPKEVIRGLQAVVSHTGAKKAILGIKKKYTAISETFKSLVEQTNIELAELGNFYPAGDEQILIHEITNKTIPPLGLPKDEGILVANVASLYSVSNAMDGKAITQKFVTVTGEVAEPAVIQVPIGANILECIEHCGGFTIPDPVVILGGPMMGRFVTDMDALAGEVVTKTTGGVIAIPRGHFLEKAATLSPAVMQKRAATACIQCRICTEMCPRYLVGHGFETHRVMRAFAGGPDHEGKGAIQAMMCCECGVCELFACPMGLSPRRINVFLKNRFREEKVQYNGPRDVNPHQTDFREFRRVPTPRLASKIDIARYLDIQPVFSGQYAPARVVIPLGQHIGVPARPVVKMGDQVQLGECIAEIPEGALGAKIHASISGKVTTIDHSITIEGI